MVSGKLTRRIGISAATQQLQRTQPKKTNESKFITKYLQDTKNVDYDYFLNPITKRRQPSLLREMAQKMTTMPSDTILFGIGVPNGNTFPFKSININLKDGSNINIIGKDLESALQYLPSRGYVPLIQQLQNFTDRVHGNQDWEKQGLIITAGTQESLCNSIEMCLNEGDTIIIPSPMYVGTVDLFKPYLPRYIDIPQDQDGIRPDILQQKLEQTQRDGIPLPKLMYTNPTGCNPTGVNISNKRKRKIYELACNYNFIILEDDPYYFLHFMDENPESFLSMDTEGRVLRFDSFSKIMSSGLRLGFVTGPSTLLRKIELHIQVSTLHTSALSQILLYKLIEKWGLDRLMENFKEVQMFYKDKRDNMIAACNKHLTGLAEWNIPNGGMFIWLRINGINDTYQLAMKECIERCMLIVPGHPFFMKDKDNCLYVRLSYSIPTNEQIDQGCAKLAEIIRHQLPNKT